MGLMVVKLTEEEKKIRDKEREEKNVINELEHFKNLPYSVQYKCVEMFLIEHYKK